MPSTGIPSLPPRPKRRKGRPFLKFMISLVVLLLTGALSYAGYLYYELHAAMDNIAGDPGAPRTEKPAEQHHVTVLLLGIDTRAKGGSLNSDVIMIATLNPQRKSATVVSIPRDTLLKLKGYSSGKANSYYAAFRNADKKTADEKTKTLFGRYLDIPIDYVAKIDFKGFVEVVDKVGGLTVDVDMNMCYTDKYDGTSIKLAKGTRLLTGGETLDFVRYRKGNCQGAADSNDIERNERQQQVIDRMIGKLKTPEGLLKLGSVIETVGNNVDTDIPSSEIRTMLRTYIGIDRDKINYVHLTGEWESPYITIRPDELKRAQDALKEQLQ